MTPSHDKQQKTVLITGCSSGIGYGCAHGLQQRGYRVFATARKARDVKRLQGEGLESLSLDLDRSGSIDKAVNEILERTNGQLFALFNNAGYGQVGAVEDLSRAAIRANFETNVFGTMELTNRIIPVMRRQGEGRIVQNSSLFAYSYMAWRGAYPATKYAIEGFTDTLRLELAGSGIHVSLIEPGAIKSNFRKNAFAAYEKNIDRIHSVHRDTYARVEKRLKSQTGVPFAKTPQAVLEKLIHALESPRPRIRYPVTVPAHAFYLLRRLLSSRAMDRLMARVSAAENRD